MESTTSTPRIRFSEPLARPDVNRPRIIGLVYPAVAQSKGKVTGRTSSELRWSFEKLSLAITREVEPPMQTASPTSSPIVAVKSALHSCHQSVVDHFGSATSRLSGIHAPRHIGLDKLWASSVGPGAAASSNLLSVRTGSDYSSSDVSSVYSSIDSTSEMAAE